MFSIYGSHFNSKSTVIPNTLDCDTYSIFVSDIKRFNLECLNCRCFIATIMHLLFFLFKIIWSLLHQEKIRFSLNCNVFSISGSCMPLVYIEESSVNVSFVVDLLLLRKDMSLINMQKSSGPRIEPFGTPEQIVSDFDFCYNLGKKK